MAFYWSRATSSGVYIRRFLVPLRWWSSSAFSWTWWQWPTLPPCRKSPITTTGVMLLQGDPSFHDWAFFLGLAVASDLEVLLAPFLYNSLEFVGNDFIKVFTCFLYFGCSCKCLVAWWLPWLPHHQSLPSGPGLRTSPGALVYNLAALLLWGRQSFPHLGLSDEVAVFLLLSWRQNTQLHCGPHITACVSLCVSWKVDRFWSS